ncbi:hypothetical protein GW17_00022110 [Ensete ventricosum]|nr:hypothetical protein GW17_00022110 [Ensete ventricosum]
MGFPSLGGGQLDVRKEKLFPDHKIGIPRAPFRLRRRSHNHTPNRLLPKHPSPTPPAIASVPSQSYPTRYPESKATRVDSSSASFNGLSHRNDNWGPLKVRNVGVTRAELLSPTKTYPLHLPAWRLVERHDSRRGASSTCGGVNRKMSRERRNGWAYLKAVGSPDQPHLEEDRTVETI